ncbi:MAG: hypothetical protein ABIP88_11730 [Candidatus Binatia bacterium]
MDTAHITGTHSQRAEPDKLDLLSQDIAGDKQVELLRLFPEIRSEGGKKDRKNIALERCPIARMVQGVPQLSLNFLNEAKRLHDWNGWNESNRFHPRKLILLSERR